MRGSANPPLTVQQPLYVSRPLMSWIFGTAQAALVAVYLVSIGRSGTLFVLPDAWPAYLVSTVFAAIAAWMISRPSISVTVDTASGALDVGQHWLLGGQQTRRIPIANIADVTVAEIQTNDGCLYQAEIVERDGTRLPLSQQLQLRRSCENVVARVRDELRLPAR